jgi:hypothetical protein
MCVCVSASVAERKKEREKEKERERERERDNVRTGRQRNVTHGVVSKKNLLPANRQHGRLQERAALSLIPFQISGTVSKIFNRFFSERFVVCIHFFSKKIVRCLCTYVCRYVCM